MSARLSSRSRRHAAVVFALGAGFLLAFGCGTSSAPPPPPKGAAGAPSTKASVVASASASELPKINFNDSDFTESDTSRDPFHSFAKLFAPVASSANVPQYTVYLEKYGIDELKLVAIVNAGDGIRAMFVDPQGKGWVVTRGMHIGKGEMVRLGAGVTSAYPLYWKIDRIKPEGVVLVREDSLHPEVAPTYREVPLHVEGEKS